MRLSKLAKELSRTPSELIVFFEKRGHKKYTGANSKIVEEHVELAFKKYRPELLKAELKNENTAILPSKKEGTDVIIETMPDDNNATAIVEVDSPGENQEADQNSGLEKVVGNPEDVEEIEVIRAPKIKLDGIKVVGKIDLPEKKKSIKEEESIDKKIARKVLFSTPSKKSEPEYRSERIRSDKNIQTRDKRHNQRRPQLSYEEKLRRDEERQKRDRNNKQKNLKEQKKQYYVKNIQPKVQPSNKKKSKKDKGADLKIRKERPVYKNPIRRFIAWLNCEYDQYV